MVTTGITYDWDSTGSFVNVSGPFARTNILLLPSAVGVIIAGSENIYRPWVTNNVALGSIIWPIEQMYDLPVLQTAGTSVLCNFGSATTALSLPGFTTTCAVSGTDSTLATIASLSNSTVPPQGSWKAALGPCMNSPDSRRPESYYWTSAISSGDYQIDNTPGSPYAHVPSGWVTGNGATVPLTGFPGGSTTIVVFDRHPTVINSQLKRFLLPMGTPGRVTVSVTWNTLLVSSGAGEGFLNNFPVGIAVSFSIPTITSGGGQSLQVLTFSRNTVQFMRAPAGASTGMRIAETFDVQVPPFAVELSVSLVWGNNGGSANISVLQPVQASASITLQHETAVLRPAVVAAGLSSNAITTLTLSSALITESNPTNSLLLGVCQVNPAGEEFLVDVEGVMGSAYQRELMLTTGTSPYRGPTVRPLEVTPMLEHVVQPTESGTFLFPLAANLASRVLPSLFRIGKKVLPTVGGAIMDEFNHQSDEHDKREAARKEQLAMQQASPKIEVVKIEKEKTKPFVIRNKMGQPVEISEEQARQILLDNFQSATATRIVAPAVVDMVLSRKQKKKLRSRTSVATYPVSTTGFTVVDRYNLIGTGVIPPPGLVTVHESDGLLSFSTCEGTFRPLMPIPAGVYECVEGVTPYLLSVSTTGVVTGSDLVEALNNGGAAWGVGILGTPRRPQGASFWIVHATCDRPEPCLTYQDGTTHVREPAYKEFGNLKIDERLLDSFDDLGPAFQKAYETSNMYVTSYCSLDADDLHGAHGGSLIAPTLAAMSGIPRPGLVLTGTPYDGGKPAVPDALPAKELAVRCPMYFPLGPLPCYPPAKLAAMVTNGRNGFPTLEQFGNQLVHET
jgi:hypothetical protein